MIVRVLGSAAGGGVPQWNCGCENCAAARHGRQPMRSQSSVAVSVDGERWLLLNCSPDIDRQIQAFPSLQPRSRRDTPIDGMLLTDANVDHIGGLATLRQTGSHRFIVRSSTLVRDIATAQAAFAPFARPPHRWPAVIPGEECAAVDDRDLVGNRIRVRAIAVPGSTPGYAGRHAAEGAVLAYELGTAEATLLYAPVFSGVSEGLKAAIDRADAAFLDGSFYTDDELVRRGLMSKTARGLGHNPVGGAGGTLAQLDGRRSRIIFTHLNNSNPMLEPSSAAFAAVSRAGCAIAYDGMEFGL